MKLHLVRHAIAEQRGTVKDDNSRALTDEGKTKMSRAARGLDKMKVRPNLILASPLKRALETAEILANGLGGPKLEVLAELAPGTDPGSVVSALKRYSKARELMLVGHEPDLSYLVSFLLTGAKNRLSMNFKKGGVICLDADFSGNPPNCVLEWFMTPKLLRSL